MNKIVVIKTKKDIDKALEHLSANCSKMSFLIKNLERPPLSKKKNYFQSLVQAIVYQQLNGKVAATIFSRFVDLFPNDSFPTPQDVKKKTVNRLRKAGLSERKATYIKCIADFFLENEITPRKINKMPNDEIKELFIQIKGVGSWTVDMFLMSTLNRRDVLPVGDYGIRVGFKYLYDLDDLPDEDFMYKKAKKWQPYRTIASSYLWSIANNGMSYKEFKKQA